MGMLADVFVKEILGLDQGVLVYGCGSFYLTTPVVRPFHSSG